MQDDRELEQATWSCDPTGMGRSPDGFYAVYRSQERRDSRNGLSLRLHPRAMAVQGVYPDMDDEGTARRAAAALNYCRGLSIEQLEAGRDA